MPIDMVRVPDRRSITEVMVDRRTGRSWTVTVNQFDIATTVVTVGQWNALVGVETEPERANLPMVDVNWRQAVWFCNEMSRRDGLTAPYTVTPIDRSARERPNGVPHHGPIPDDWCVTWGRAANGYRLPTDAEWQVACRAGSTGPRYGNLDEIAWYACNSGGSLQSVAGKAPNAWGLYDTLGGVWEWCWDLYDVGVYGSYRVLRGGGWNDPHWGCRLGVRRKTHPSAAFDDLGFRLARNVTLQGDH